ncbi:hypothetical protein ACFYPZ_02120 [Streptomyces sp. NPDC005506]|uniref:hypothetical protein n=1 Tax=unclassified Streptomyces TaxID=2593676 RepID=UPI003681B7A6
MGDTRVDDRGLAEDGTIGREGPPSRVPAAFAPVVEASRSRITDAFDAAQLCSAYLYGSIPRGTAIPGVHDLDLLLARYAEPTAQSVSPRPPAAPLRRTRHSAPCSSTTWRRGRQPNTSPCTRRARLEGA